MSIGQKHFGRQTFCQRSLKETRRPNQSCFDQISVGQMSVEPNVCRPNGFRAKGADLNGHAKAIVTNSMPGTVFTTLYFLGNL
jgi:hypothetical protein